MAVWSIRFALLLGVGIAFLWVIAHWGGHQKAVTREALPEKKRSWVIQDPFCCRGVGVVPWLERMEERLFFVGKNERPDREGGWLVEWEGKRQEVSPLFQLDQWELLLKEEEGKVFAEVSLKELKSTFEVAVHDQKVAWMEEGMRVDGGWVSKKLAWGGEDLFLSQWGEEEYQGNLYFEMEGEPIWVKKGEGLIWKEKQWQKVTIGQDSRNWPLLSFETTTDRVLTYSFWSAQGEKKINGQFFKTASNFVGAKTVLPFYYLGVKGAQQWLVEIQGRRASVAVGDWWLLQEGIWQKLTTRQEIEEYVEKKRIGELLVVEGLEAKGGKKTLMGKLYTRNRCQVIPIQWQMQPAAGKRRIAVVT